MEGITIRHWIETPVRYQEIFDGKNLEDFTLDHFLYALPGPQCPEYPEKERKVGAEDSEPLEILLDVVQFQPEDIIIQIFEGWLIVKAEHGRRMDEHGFISRSFMRTYKLPNGIELKDLSAVFCHDGVLAIRI
ncbi:PREDICTED: heat shock protein beta-3 [Nanorana parkeri]|uniref:heat shock protein beta-3 n=1 Tax=Nanorana parkeri TaxID=125878 RepID=UPI0008542842|nr:PREDICTED: heat shock protein beta-3 [Nanorana parkeri]